MTPPRPPPAALPALGPRPLGPPALVGARQLPLFFVSVLIIYFYLEGQRKMLNRSLSSLERRRILWALKKGLCRGNPQPLPAPSYLRPGSAPWGQLSGQGSRNCKRRAGRRARSATGGLRGGSRGCLAPAPSLPQARQGLRLSYNEICSRPSGLGVRVGRASLGLGMGSTSRRSSWGDRAGPHRSRRRPGWGLGRFGEPDVPRRSSARPPFCRMCLRPLFRFRRYFLQRPKNVQIGFKSDQETEEAAAQVRPCGACYLSCSLTFS